MIKALGSHVSLKAPEFFLGSVKEALSYGSTAFMFYTGAPQNTRRLPLDRLMIEEGLSLWKENGMDNANLVVHAPYIINLAYRKDTFFAHGGFSDLMNESAGDDDLFVNQVATKANTAVVINRDSLTWSPAKKTMKEWWQQKRRHLSVSPNYRIGTQIRLALEPLTRGLFYALVIAMMVLYCPQIQLWPWEVGALAIPFLAAIGLFLLRWFIQTGILNASAHKLGLKRMSLFSVLWFDIVLPLVNLYMLIVPQRKNNKW